MAGAIIPNDWDGSTFNCQRIEWPASPLWQAILLGQVTEPAWSSYWDPDTGDVGEATQAVQAAFDLTIPDVYLVECDIVVPTAAFKAYKNVGQSLPATTWVTIEWDLLDYDLNTPNFSLALNEHKPVNEDLMGLWHYDIKLAVDTGSIVFAQAIELPGLPGTYELAFTGTDRGYVDLGFDYNWDAVGKGIAIQFWSVDAAPLSILFKNCQFSGHRVGPTA